MGDSSERHQCFVHEALAAYDCACPPIDEWQIDPYLDRAKLVSSDARMQSASADPKDGSGK